MNNLFANAETGKRFGLSGVAPQINQRTWLQQMIERGKREDFQIKLDITPDLANLLLTEHNGRNRPLRKSGAESWAQDIISGKWRVLSQGISLASDGHLNNGQHRLAGIALSGMTVPCWVMFGEEVEAFFHIDKQRRRTDGDALHILGEKNVACLAAAVRVFIVVQSTQARSMTGSVARAINSEMVAETLMHHPDLREAAGAGSRFSGSIAKTSSAGAAVAFYLIKTRSKKAALLGEFWDKLCTGINITQERDPVRILRRGFETGRLVRIKSASGPHTAACIIIAWNQWSQGKLANGVSWPDREPFPEPK